MGVLISLFIQLFALMVSVMLSLVMTIINLTVLLVVRSAKRPRRRASRPKGGAGGLVLAVFVLLVAVVAVPRLAVLLTLLAATVAAVWWLVKRSGRYRTVEGSELARLFENVRLMDERQFEAFTANLFRAMGHEVTMIGSSGDQGVDLLVDMDGQRVAVQCKNYAKPVGNKPVQEVYAGAKYHGCPHAWVVAPAGYTKGAVDLAQRIGVLLYDANSVRQWIGQVDAARIRQEAAVDSAPRVGANRPDTPRGIWYPHPDDDPNQKPPAERTG